MTFTRKPIVTPDGTRQTEIKAFAHKVLMAASETVARACGTTGASATVLFATLLWEEWAELDHGAARRFHGAVATILDPKASPARKAHAETIRARAVRDLYAALDLEMADTEGTG